MSLSSLPPGIDLSQIPAGTPPPGVVSNFVNPENLVAPAVAITAIFVPLAIAFVAVRVYVRTVDKNFGWDDGFIVAALVISLVYTGSIMGTIKYSRHMWNVPLSWFLEHSYVKLLYVQGMTLGPALFFGKTSILLFYLRLFSVNQSLKYWVYPAIPIIFGCYITNIILETTFCIPRAGDGGWSFNTLTRCGRFEIYGPIQGVMNIAMDVYILVIPVPIIVGLKMSSKKKAGLLGIFFTATLGIIASALATKYRFDLYHNPGDTTWIVSQLFICVTVENYIIILCSCIPVVAGFMKGRFPKLSVLFPTLTSRIMRSKPTTAGSESNPSRFVSGGSKFANSSMESQDVKEGTYHYPEAPTGNGYYELRDTLPLAGKGVRSNVSAMPTRRETDLESGINKWVSIDQHVSHSAV